jgi:uncharacterized protein YdhG (YjbR/CyaY superfamily)
MKTREAPASTVDEYIGRFPADVQRILQKVRATIKKAAPKAEERISYGMPGYFLNGHLVWFGGHPNHIGFYPTGQGITTFKQELAGYKTSKGAVQFPLAQPVPYALITKMVKQRVQENEQKKHSKSNR